MGLFRAALAAIGGGVVAAVDDAQRRGDGEAIDRLLPTTGIPRACVDGLNKGAHAGEPVTSFDLLGTHVPKQGEKLPWEW